MEARIVKQPNGCWNVRGYQVHGGYVHIHLGRTADGKPIKTTAHRLAWQLWRGPIPSDREVLHSCDNPRCCNPDHLSLGTHRDNILDSVRKGRYNCFGRQKLNAEQVHEIRALAARGLLQKDIAARFGIKRNTVSGIVNGKSWGHLQEVSQTVDPQAEQSLSQEDIVSRVFERVPCVHLSICGEVR